MAFEKPPTIDELRLAIDTGELPKNLAGLSRDQLMQVIADLIRIVVNHHDQLLALGFLVQSMTADNIFGSDKVEH